MDLILRRTGLNQLVYSLPQNFPDSEAVLGVWCLASQPSWRPPLGWGGALAVGVMKLVGGLDV